MTIQDVRVSPWTPNHRRKKHQSPEELGVNNLERKRQKKREFSVENLHILRWRQILKLPQAGLQLRRAIHDEHQQHGGHSQGPNLLIRIRYA
ncbi:hypothetical protein AVEN_134068-1 [Araneus ventricosus]|uniref:Uncharacterized protein n=1 Tax=Araneus ventricosus TaxID=182803 RepID=A0A4Y2X2Z1_ARAVE|nr:hypothetical protein AVEN_134068-1 [Araneus ventricosus]